MDILTISSPGSCPSISCLACVPGPRPKGAGPHRNPVNSSRGHQKGAPRFAGVGRSFGAARELPASGPPWYLGSASNWSPESGRSCHLKPWGVTADTDGDRLSRTSRPGALTRTDSLGHTAFRGFQKGTSGSGRGCSQALPPRERRRSPHSGRTHPTVR